MASLLVLLLLLVVFGGTAFLLWWFQGLWGCLITLVNTLFAASLAGMVAGPLAALLSGWLPALDRAWYFLVLCTVFSQVVILATEVSRRVSRTAVPFHPLVERIATPVVALLTAWIVMAFTAASLHAAPLPKNAIPQGMLLGLAPDRGWLGWTVGVATKPPFGSAGGWFIGRRRTVDGLIAYFAERRDG
ncbi:MAG TPA: hypothetical protein DC048_08945, partial [Planctomycetaceae bacterium]|nr:hypothetical protein [Planctomycetaceae bacterium]